MKKIVEIKDDLIIGKNGDQDLTADLFIPSEGTENGAAIVFVHGGGWREGDKAQLRGYGILLAREGFVCLCTLIDSPKKLYGPLKYKMLSVQ